MCFYQSGSKSSIKAIATLIILGLLLAACTSSGTRAPVEDAKSTARPTTDGSSIDQMIAGMEPAAAILLLENRASNTTRDRAFELLVRATEIAIDHEFSQAIDTRLQSLYQRYPDSNKAVRLGILKNRILLARGNTEQVVESLDKLLQRATPREKLLISSLKAEALLQLGFPIESVQLRIALDSDYQKYNPEKQSENDNRLWNSLMQVHPDLISGNISEIPDTFSGWLELAHIAHRYQFDSTTLNSEIDRWITRNPGHPANRHIIDFIKKKQVATSKHPTHVALVLPLSGKLAAVGKAIRDGFMSAYLESSRIFGTQITIDIYDTQGDAENTIQAVELANKRGTQFIVGPLSKDAVSAAIAANQSVATEPVTLATGDKPVAPVNQPAPLLTRASMLTLNRAPTSMLDDSLTESPAMAPSDPVVYQFDLAPETEATQVAEHASLIGHNYAMVMVPENIWGNRIYEAFTERYQELGGEIIALQRFKKGSADFSTNIQQAINLNVSKVRHKQLESLLYKELGFTPRRRQDIDMIFIAASPQEARQIKPQLKFFYADNIPVYATSSIYSGSPNPGRDKDLEDIRFCDMPWLLTSKPEAGSLHSTIATAWPQETTRYLRFHALGADAFQLLPQLEWLKHNNNDWISGGTGRLSLNIEGIVQRQLSWASFKQAIPVLDPAFSN